MEEAKVKNIRPKYTLNWLGTHTLFVIGISMLMAFIAMGFDNMAWSRFHAGLLSESDCNLVDHAMGFCFAVIAITLVSIMIVEVAFRKAVNYFQYILIAAALTVFYLLLLAMTEKMPFWLSYTIVSAMTIGLISWFMTGVMDSIKAGRLAAMIIFVEYLLIFLLIQLGSMALLVGSLALFILIAVAMYFSLRLKMVDDELVLKK